MPDQTRQDVSAIRRMAHHLTRIRQETTAIRQLWRACTWLVAEARQARCPEDVTRAVLGLVEHLRQGQPLPQVLHEAGRKIEEAPIPDVPDLPCMPRRKRRTRRVGTSTQRGRRAA